MNNANDALSAWKLFFQPHTWPARLTIIIAGDLKMN